jgi:pimeloyl-ACP methyl ester carboxylesterase
MPSAAVNRITIEYETTGDPAHPALLLIAGLGGQLTAWDERFVAALVAKGFYVVRHDNRDVGRSTWFDEAGAPDPLVALAGNAQAAYSLADMADDAAGLLEALGVECAHVLGVSMGGMIAQTLALRHPGRVQTLTSIMSTTGDPAVGQPHPEAVAALLALAATDRETAVETAVQTWRVIGSPGFPFHEDRVRVDARVDNDRAFHPDGTVRQLVAILSSPDRTPDLKALDLPTLVIHGDSDPLVDPTGGSATAAAIPGATLWMIEGMGHQVPPELFGEIADRVAAHGGL